MQQAGY